MRASSALASERMRASFSAPSGFTSIASRMSCGSATPCLRSAQALARSLIHAWRPFPGRKCGLENAREMRSWRARRIAEAQVDLLRVRRARHDLISRAFSNPHFRPGKGLHAWIRLLAKACALLKQGVALPQDMRDAIEVKPLGAEKLALILSDASAELARMDRYERRALWRRKYAIREFDAARAAVAASPRGQDLGPGSASANFLSFGTVPTEGD